MKLYDFAAILILVVTEKEEEATGGRWRHLQGNAYEGVYKVQSESKDAEEAGIKAWHDGGNAWFARRGTDKAGGRGPLPRPCEVAKKMKERHKN